MADAAVGDKRGRDDDARAGGAADDSTATAAGDGGATTAARERKRKKRWDTPVEDGAAPAPAPAVAAPTVAGALLSLSLCARGAMLVHAVGAWRHSVGCACVRACRA
jgi:hypothetical protein